MALDISNFSKPQEDPSELPSSVVNASSAAAETLPVATGSGLAAWVKPSSFTYPGATLLVAASDSSTKAKNAADYVCTGTNDDATINTALAALPAAGGRVLLAEGQGYTIGNTGIKILAGSQHLFGLDRRDTLLSFASGSTAPAAITVGTSGTGNLFNNSIRHLSIDGTNGLSTANGIVASSNAFKAEDLYLQVIPQDAISLSSFITTEFAFQRLLDIDVYEVGRDGIVTDANIDDLLCQAVTVGGTYTVGGRYGFNLLGSYLRLIGCRAHDMANGWGVYATGAFLLSIIGGHFDENGGLVAGGGIHADSSTRLAVLGNTFNSNDSYDVYLSSASSATIGDNRSNGAGTKGPKATAIYATGCTGGTIHDNTITDVNQANAYGITVASSAHMQVHDNVLLNPNNAAQQPSIRLYAATYCNVHDNVVSNGISEENTSDHNFIRDNDLQGGVVAQVGANTQVRAYAAARPKPSDVNGVLAWSLEPAGQASSGVAVTAGSVTLAKLMIPETITLTNIGTITTGTGTGTSGQCFMVAYDHTGTQIAQSADMHTLLASAGDILVPVVTPVTVKGGPGVFIWAGLCWNGTMPTVVRGNASAESNNFGTSFAASNIRFARTSATYTTTPPSSFDPTAALIATFSHFFAIT